MKYYLIEKQKSNEGAVLFWKTNSKGYTSNFDDAGLYSFDFVKNYYLGKSSSTFAIEKDKFEMMMKTIKIVYNYSDFYNLMYDIENSKEKEDCWYCEQCSKAMDSTEEGVYYQDVGYCSQECIDERRAQE